MRCPQNIISLKRHSFKIVISVLGMFFSPENDIYLRDKHCKLGLCPGLLNRLYEQCLPMRRLLAPFLNGSLESASHWHREHCSGMDWFVPLKIRPGMAGQIKCLYQLCSPHLFKVRGFGHYMVAPSHPTSHKAAGRRRQSSGESVSEGAAQLTHLWSFWKYALEESIKLRSYEVWSQI